MIAAAITGPNERDVRAPGSFSQQRLWLLDRLLPTRSIYNSAYVLRLDGELNVGALRAALNALARRHDMLRTCFAFVDGNLVQLIRPEIELDWQEMDLRVVPPAERDAEARRRACAEAQTEFDLDRVPLFRIRLLRIGQREHWLLLTLHHIIWDAWSSVVLAREVSALYAASCRGEASPLPDLPVQYADYAAWQRQWLQGEVLERQLAYWRQALANLPPLQLPTDRLRPATASYRGGRVIFELGGTLTRALKELGRREAATLFMTLLASFQVLLHRYTGQEDLAVGVPTAGRLRPELEHLIGFFVNTLVLRGNLSGDPSFRDYLGRVRERALAAYAHQDVPFEKLVEELAPVRDPSRNPLFQATFALQNTARAEWRLPQIEVERLDGISGASAKFDLTLSVTEVAGTLRARMDYAADLFDAATIKRMTGHWRMLLEDVIADPDRPVSRLRLMNDADRQRVLVTWNATRADFPSEQPVAAIFAAQAQLTPDAVAVSDGERMLNYAELDARSRELAHRLRDSGVVPGARIGVCIDRSIEEIVALVGVLKAGCVYVPLDPAHPSERLASLLADADAAAVVTTGSALHALARARAGSARPVITLDAANTEEVTNRLDPAFACGGGDIAYVMYTSGSTGVPKGVAVPQRAIVRLVCGTDYVHLGSDDVIAHLSNPAFDAATFEVWGALLNGARLALVPREVVLSPQRLADALDRHGVTVLFLTTALFNRMTHDAPRAFAGRQVLFGGEVVEPRCVAAALRQGRPKRLVHVYGPTEATTFATWHEVSEIDPDAPTVPIGRPIANTEVYLLDRNLQPVPPGVPGEIFIGGPGLAQGYFGRPDLTAEQFVAHPFDPNPAARLYRTGDRARYRDDGSIEFIGRLDRQVKIRGHRIEPAEVEAALLQLPQVRDAVVTVRGDTVATRQLVAYVVAAASSAPPPANLWGDLKPLLPEYMLPASIIWLKSLPLNASGKVDRRGLPAVGESGAPRAGVRVMPRDMLEQVLVDIWERVLDVDGIGVFDHFFELGGHSLLAARLLDEIEHETGFAAPLPALFADDTIAGLARLLRECPADLAAPIVTINEAGTRPPLVFLHGALRGGGFYSRSLAHALGSDQPVLVVKPHTLDEAALPDTIEAMATDRIRALRAIRPRGPYCVGGFCNGAFVAFEMARQLIAAGDEVPLVIAIEARAPHGAAAKADEGYLVLNRGDGSRILAPHGWESELRYLKAMDTYVGGPYNGHLVLIHSRERDDPARDLGWSRFAAKVEIHSLPGDHMTLVARQVGELAQVIRGAMRNVFERAGA